MLCPAPLLANLAEGPAGMRAVWVRAGDGVRLRVGLCPAGSRGTVLLFPGRTEYIEKYGRVAADLAAAGYGAVLIDWRGQGLSDRLLDDRSIGHVGRFADYQNDVRALLGAVRALSLPKPLYLLAHSMGGAIGLAALCAGLPVQGAVFSAPMWNIAMTPGMRALALALAWSARRLRFGHCRVSGSGARAHVLNRSFDKDNALTRDRDSWDHMRRQMLAWPDLALGGPSLHWLGEALAECRRLAALPTPKDMPALVLLGGGERVVSASYIRARMRHWPGGTIIRLDGAGHEVLMELPATRRRALEAAIGLFATSGRRNAARQRDGQDRRDQSATMR